MTLRNIFVWKFFWFKEDDEDSNEEDDDSNEHITCSSYLWIFFYIFERKKILNKIMHFLIKIWEKGFICAFMKDKGLKREKIKIKDP